MADRVINKLLDIGRDAMSNLYDVVIDPIAGLTFDELRIRIKDFQPPESNLGEYDRFYKGRKITLTNAQMEQDKKTEFEFAIDQNWGEYKKLLKLRNRLFNPKTGTIRSGIEARTTIKVIAYSHDDDTQYEQAGVSDSGIAGDGAMIWVFENAMVTKLGNSGFTRESSDPMTGTVEWLFTNFYEDVDE